MTAIIVIKDGRKIIMGADSVASAGNVISHFKTKEEFKIGRINGSPHCVIGCSGSSAVCKAIRTAPNLLDGKDDPSYEYIVKNFVPKMFSIGANENAIKMDKDSNAYLELSVLIATKSHIYKINDYGDVWEVNNFDSIGSGSLQCNCKYLGIKNNKSLSLKDKARLCLENAVKYNSNIGYPLVFIQSDEEGIDVIEKPTDTFSSGKEAYDN